MALFEGDYLEQKKVSFFSWNNAPHLEAIELSLSAAFSCSLLLSGSAVRKASYLFLSFWATSEEMAEAEDEEEEEEELPHSLSICFCFCTRGSS